ncbi:hypothetical protein BJ138DRAFT_1014309 [Hygrophoropsis aurantiaca]|uniref:Uncharacterized protein n=1 Tax=Hygrophoropsis aurantiaca TaxID=72124 RepID=A0ACB8A453_9AGAM|nr:hypothetical protein BJ138DRAFT_1014309 [Hygrophoropsis aurantiaca]
MQQQQPEQPSNSKLSLKGLLTFPYRLCNPPPAVGKVRSCGVTPILDVRLEDILERKHLPPLGLKDFEEYLLYVEQSPENLYFLLWLKEYSARYHAWSLRVKATHSAPDCKDEPDSPRNFSPPPTPDPSLALFYARAKQTFFTPNGQYELNVPSDILAPFHSSSPPSAFIIRNRPPTSHWHSQNAHPDPAAFTEVSLEARKMLKDSLSLFVRAAYTNVGSRRAACGIAAGCLFILLCGILPLTLITGGWAGTPRGRLLRLAAFPGMWLGLTILIASLHGVCLMVYIFGDLRQLRKFELARPPISRPIPITRIESISAPLPCRRQGSNVRLAQLLEKEEAPISPITYNSDGCHPFNVQARASSSGASSTCSSSSCETCAMDSTSSFEAHDIDIDISPAYFDPVPAPEGPATSTALYRSPPSSIAFPAAVYSRPHPDPSPLAIATSFHPPVQTGSRKHSKSKSTVSDKEFGPSAGFIPHDSDSESDSHHGSRRRRAIKQRQRDERDAFDFDLLPKAAAARMESHTIGIGTPILARNQGEKSILPEMSSSSSSRPISSVLGRAQYKCNKRPHTQSPVSSSFDPSTPHSRPASYFGMTLTLPSFTAGVPAFAAPMTRVRSPVVVRAQWEIVVRAAALAALGAGVLIGVIAGVVP